MNTVLEVPLRQVCTRFLFFCFFLILYIQLNQLILDVRTSKVLRRHLAGFFFFFFKQMSLAQRTRSLVYVPRPPPVLRSPAQGLMAGCIQERFTHN